MKHFGDITKIRGDEVPIVDIVTGGSPCQDLSVAGKREGLAGERSGLFMEQIRVIKEMRENDKASGRTDKSIRPRYMVWENVPGAFSSNKGQDFQAVIEETAKIADKNASIPRLEGGQSGLLQVPYWQTGGALLGEYMMRSFGECPSEERESHLSQILQGGGAPEILFERESLPRDSEQSEAEREEVAGSIGAGTYKAITFQERGGRPGGGKGILIQNDRTGALSTVNNQMVFDASRRHDYQQFEDVCETVQAHYGSGGGNVPMVVNEVVALNDQGGSVMGVSKNITGALRAQEHGHQPIVFEPGAASRVGGHVYEDKAGTVRANAGDNQQAVVYGISSYNSNAMKSDNPNSGIYEAETARTIDLNGGNPACNQGGMAVCFGEPYNATTGSFMRAENSGVAETLMARDYKDPQVVMPCTYNNTSVVRRLTPMECERLQGYPDGWTNIGEWVDSKGKKHKAADSPRYKALGNSIALPFWQWMAERMVRLIKNDEPEKEPTMASLFDGIGGFPLVYSRCGCKPVWCSEIEEFPMAVTKIRFPDKDDMTQKEQYEVTMRGCNYTPHEGKE